MALTKTLAQLRTSLLIRAGMNSTGTSVDLTAAVLNEIINDAIYEGWDVIVNKWLDYYTAGQVIAVTSGSDTYPLASDFYKLRAVWILDGTTKYLRLNPTDLDAAHRLTGNAVGSHGSYRYRLTNRNIVLMPVPSSDETIRVFYVPLQPELTADADSIRFEVPIELKYILAIAWRDILDRQSLDPSPALAKMQQYEAKLRTAADGLDASEPFYLNPAGPRYDDDYDEVD